MPYRPPSASCLKPQTYLAQQCAVRVGAHDLLRVHPEGAPVVLRQQQQLPPPIAQRGADQVLQLLKAGGGDHLEAGEGARRNGTVSRVFR